MPDTPDGTSQEDNPRHSLKPAKSIIVRVFRTFKRRHNRDRHPNGTEHERNEKAIANWTRRLGIFTFFLVLLTGLTAVILWKSDQTTQRRDRAFVYFGDPPITPYPPGNIDRWGVAIVIQNAGNMPARRVKVEYDCPSADAGQNVADPFPLAKWNDAQIGSVIGPKQGSTVQACNIPIDTLNAAQKHTKDVFYVVRVTYLDGFSDDLRVTEMSRAFRFDQWAEALWFTGPHNCSDGDCPK